LLAFPRAAAARGICHVRVPLPQAGRGQLLHLQIAERRKDESLRASASVVGAALVLDVAQIVLDNALHGERTGLGLFCQSLLLRLREVEDRLAVGLAVIVGNHAPQAFDLVALRADVTAHGPSAGPTAQPAITEMQSRLDQSPIRLALSLEARAGLARVQPAVLDDARHCRSCPFTTTCPIFFQYT